MASLYIRLLAVRTVTAAAVVAEVCKDMNGWKSWCDKTFKNHYRCEGPEKRKKNCCKTCEGYNGTTPASTTPASTTPASTTPATCGDTWLGWCKNSLQKEQCSETYYKKKNCCISCGVQGIREASWCRTYSSTNFINSGKECDEYERGFCFESCKAASAKKTCLTLKNDGANCKGLTSKYDTKKNNILSRRVDFAKLCCVNCDPQALEDVDKCTEGVENATEAQTSEREKTAHR